MIELFQRRNGTRLIAHAACIGALSAPALAVSITPGVPIEYHLEGSYAFGCFDPCLCPISFTDDLTGSFTLTPGFGLIVTKGVYSYQPFDIDDMALLVNTFGGRSVEYAGSGTYALISGEDGVLRHQMILELTTDGRTFTQFDSGLVPVEPSFPQINIAVSINGMFCLDTVFSIDASPDVIAGDITGDGVVDGVDLGFLLSAWSIPPGTPGCAGWGIPAPCPADLNGDGVVDGIDLGMLLSSWTLS
jgi:hypothetical protein